MGAADNSALTTLKNAAANTSYVAWKLTKSTGNAAWIVTTTMLVLMAPLVVEMDREQQMMEFENQSIGALTNKS